MDDKYTIYKYLHNKHTNESIYMSVGIRMTEHYHTTVKFLNLMPAKGNASKQNEESTWEVT